jgi:valyl-tRNA synthetase
LWVARMIMSGMYFNDGQVPFDDVIIHPTVFNAEGRRMSKSLGTGVDPLDLMEHYGADGMRFGLMLQVTGNQDIKFSEEKLVSSRNFANKIWNASRFVLMHLEGVEPGPPNVETVADRWILSRLASLSARVSEGLDSYEFGDVARDLYDFFWSEFCDWYIELSKARLAAGGSQRLMAQRNLVFVLDQALRLLHPMMPFVTEAIWRKLPLPDAERADSLMIAAWPDPARLYAFEDEGAERSISRLIEVVSGIRAVRARYKLAPRQGLAVVFRTAGDAENQWVSSEFGDMAVLAGVEDFSAGTDSVKPDHSATVIAAGLEVYIPLEGLVDFEAEAARLTKERTRLSTDLERLEKKLSNAGFLAKAAAEIVEKDRAKAAELADSLALVEGQLAELA